MSLHCATTSGWSELQLKVSVEKWLLAEFSLLTCVYYSVLHMLCCVLHPFLLEFFLWKIKVRILYMDYRILCFLWLWKNSCRCDMISPGWNNELNGETLHNTWYFMQINTKTQSCGSALLIWLLIGIKSGICFECFQL